MRSLFIADDWKVQLKEQLWHKNLLDSLSDKEEWTTSELKYLTLLLEMKSTYFTAVPTGLYQTPYTVTKPSRSSSLIKKLLSHLAILREPTLELVNAYIVLLSKVTPK